MVIKINKRHRYSIDVKVRSLFRIKFSSCHKIFEHIRIKLERQFWLVCNRYSKNAQADQLNYIYLTYKIDIKCLNYLEHYYSRRCVWKLFCNYGTKLVACFADNENNFNCVCTKKINYQKGNSYKYWVSKKLKGNKNNK